MSTAKEKRAVSPEQLALYGKLVATIPNLERKGASILYTSVNGHMFSFLGLDGSIGLRLPAATRDTFLRTYKTTLCEQHGVVLKEYVSVPKRLLKNTQELKEYFAISYEVRQISQAQTEREKQDEEREGQMNKNLELSQAIEIDADASRVWDTLTNPEKHKQLFGGTEIRTDWQVVNPILFQGQVQGRAYTDKGIVMRVEPAKTLQYKYWTGFSGLDDSPENYSLVTYTLDRANNKTRFTVTRVGFPDDREYQYALLGWDQVLKKSKELAEAG